MLNFKLSLPTKLVFGKDEHKNVGKLISPFAKKVLLLYGSERIKGNGIFDDVTASLKGSGIEFVALGGVVANPRISLVYKGIELAKQEGVDSVLAVGGGSVIDSAKAIAAGVLYEGDIWRAFNPETRFTPEGRVKKALPIAAILTIPAAGSEMSNVSVVSDDMIDDRGLKTLAESEFFMPRVSIINPEFFFTLPKDQLANGVSDMMAHVMERYFTVTPRTDLTDALSEATLRVIMKNAPILLDNPTDYDTWCEIGLAGTMAHNNVLGVGRLADFGCHNMEHEISALYDIPHGAGLAILFPNWMRYVYREHIDIFLQFAVNVMGVEGGFRDKESVILEGINKLSRFYRTLGLPQTLGELGIDGSRVREMAERLTGVAYGNEEFRHGFAYPLGTDEWEKILESCL